MSETARIDYTDPSQLQELLAPLGRAGVDSALLAQGNAEESLVKAVLAQHLRQHPEHAYRLAEELMSLAAEAADAEHPRMETAEVDGDVVLVNPRTGAQDSVVVVSAGIREDRAFIEADESCITFHCGGYTDTDTLLYIAASDRLPVRLPEGWVEG